MSDAVGTVVQALRLAGLSVGDGNADGLSGRYVMVTAAGTAYDGPSSDRNADRLQEVQLMSVSGTRGGCDRLAEDACGVALGPLPDPDGFTWAGDAAHAETRATNRDDSGTSAGSRSIYSRVDVIRLALTPTPQEVLP